MSGRNRLVSPRPDVDGVAQAFTTRASVLTGARIEIAWSVNTYGE